jgi:predicted phosphoadenosine phosphosulfate sulfurtransferase
MKEKKVKDKILLEHLSTDYICRSVIEKQKSNEHILISFSAGKDSIACYIACKKYFKNVHLVYLYLVPDLAFIEESLKYYEKEFNTRIIRLPHPAIFEFIGLNAFLKPHQISINWEEMYDLYKTYDYDIAFHLAKLDLKIHEDTYTAVGNRMSDSINRMSSIKTYGAINVKRKQFYPCADWKMDKLIDEIKESKIK